MMLTAFLKYWKVIAIAAALVAAFIYHAIALERAYDSGVGYQQNLQAKADAIRSDLLQADKERIEDAAKNQIAIAEAAAAKSANANYSLQQQLAEIKRIAQRNTGVVTPGGTARNAVVLLANMLGQCSEEYSRMAKFADTAHQRGKAAEDSYNSLRAK